MGRWVVALALLALAIGVAGLRVGLLQQAGGVRLSAEWALTDFYSAAYHPARALLGGDTPYTNDATYPPYAPLHLLIHLPFALLPEAAAGIAYFLFTVLLTLPLAYLALRVARVEPAGHLIVLLAAAVLLSRPGHWTLLLGQVSILLTVATYAAFAADRDRPLVAGGAVAVALLKLPYGIPLALLLWAWGRGRAVVIGVGLAALINLPFLALYAVREGGVRDLLASAAGGYRSWQALPDVNPATSSTRTDATSLVSRFIGEPLSDTAQVLLSLLILAAAAAVLRLIRRDTIGPAYQAAVAIICLAISLVGFHRGYDLVLLAAPFVAAAASRAGWPPLMRLVVLVLFTAPALNWVATESVLAAWQPGRGAWLLVTSANALCLLALFGVYLWRGTALYGRQAPASEGQGVPGLAEAVRRDL